MPTADFDWTVRAVESEVFQGTFFGDALSHKHTRPVETSPNVIRHVPVRLFTRWRKSKARALQDIEGQISQYESGVPE